MEEEDAMRKVMRCLKRDVEKAKRVLLHRKYKNKAIDYKTGRVIDWDHPGAPIFPNHVDVAIVGGGAIGCSVAYWAKKLGLGSLRIAIFEKDPTVGIITVNKKE